MYLVEIALSVTSCSRSSLPPKYAELAERTERIDFEYGPPPHGVPPFRELRAGHTRIGDFDITSKGARRPWDFEIQIRERDRGIADLLCKHSFGFHGFGLLFEYCECRDSSRDRAYFMNLDNGVDIRVDVKGEHLLMSKPRSCDIAPDDKFVTTLYDVSGDADLDPSEKGPLVAAASTRHRAVSLFIPRNRELRDAALSAFLLAVIAKPPYMHEWCWLNDTGRHIR